MSDKCRSCSKHVTSRQTKIQCSDCKSIYHGACVQMSKEDIDFLLTNSEIWRCEPCKKTRRKSMQVESQLEKSDVNIADVYKLLQEMREEAKEQVKQLETELGKSIEMCHENIEDLKKIVKTQSETLKSFKDNLDALKKENVEILKKNKELETRLDDLEQYSRANCIEIHGIPEERNENIAQLVKKMGDSIGTEINETDIDACHRLGTIREGATGRTRGIIVKFARRITKEDFLQKRRVKRNLNTKDIGFMDRPAEVIYVNESLSAGRRRVFNSVRALREESCIKFVWVRNGKILTRADDGAKVIAVTTMEQAAALQKQRVSSPAPPTTPK